MTRVSDAASHALMLTSLNRSIGGARDLQVQISSGKVGSQYADIGRDSQRLVSLEGERSRTAQFVANNKTVDLRLQQMETSVAQMTELASDARALFVNAGHHQNASDLDIAATVQHMLETVGGLLNTEQNGRSLFAGGLTDVTAVNLDNLPADGEFGADTADLTYYNGNDQVLRHRASDTLSIDYGVTAADPAFEKLIRGLKIAQTVDFSDPDGARQRIDRGLALVNEAIQDLPDVRGRIGGARAVLEKETTRMEDFQIALDESIGNIENVDLAEAISRLSEQEAQMQASLAALSRLRQVTLTNFL